MLPMSDKARELRNKLSKKEFKEFQFQLFDKFDKIRHEGLDEDEFTKQTEKIHKKMIEKLEKSFDKNPSLMKQKNKCLRLINFFLEESLSYYSCKPHLMTEEKVLDFLFDRLPQKYSMPFHEKKDALDILIFFYRALFVWKLIPKELYIFVKGLKKDKQFFVEHSAKYNGSPFFWDRDQSWVAEYVEWLKRRDLDFPVYPKNLTPKQYVGILEHMLVERIEHQLYLKRRELLKTHKGKTRVIKSLLVNYLHKWYSEPQSMLHDLSPLDIIILERSYSKDYEKGNYSH